MQPRQLKPEKMKYREKLRQRKGVRRHNGNSMARRFRGQETEGGQNGRAASLPENRRYRDRRRAGGEGQTRSKMRKRKGNKGRGEIRDDKGGKYY